MESVVMNTGFWAGKRVFLTGHTGFKGSWMSLWMQQLGAEVYGYSLAPQTQPNLFELARVESEMVSGIGDVRDPRKLAEALEFARPDFVIHMAAQSLVRGSYADPVGTYATNVMGTVNLLDAVRNCRSVRAVVIVTSDKCYQNREWFWGYRENDPLGGHDPYSSSKGCAELVTSAYRSSFFPASDYERHRVAIASVRAGNVIGGGDWANDRLIPDIISAFEKRRPARLRSPDAIRPWQHVLEPLSGYLRLARKLFEQGADYASAWNFGPHEEGIKPVRWIADNMVKLWGGEASWSLDVSPKPHEAHYLRLDAAKASSELGWNACLDLQTALEWVVEWAKLRQKGADMRAACLDQISRYDSLKRQG